MCDVAINFPLIHIKYINEYVTRTCIIFFLGDIQMEMFIYVLYMVYFIG